MEMCPECGFIPRQVTQQDSSVWQCHFDWCSSAKMGHKYAYDLEQLTTDNWKFEIITGVPIVNQVSD